MKFKLTIPFEAKVPLQVGIFLGSVINLWIYPPIGYFGFGFLVALSLFTIVSNEVKEKWKDVERLF